MLFFRRIKVFFLHGIKLKGGLEIELALQIFSHFKIYQMRVARLYITTVFTIFLFL